MEYKTICTEWQQAFRNVSLLLISSQILAKELRCENQARQEMNV